MGRRALESVPGIKMLGDFVWHDNPAIWALHCRITADVEPGGPIPRVTDWYLHVRDIYPYGQVVFYPAKVGGIRLTFNHQNHNGAGPAGLPWRCGRLCVDSSLRTLGRRSYDAEPFEPESRLAWHVQRVQEWLRLASRGELVEPGDPFELPDMPFFSGPKVVFAEGPENLPFWQGKHPRKGTASVRTLQEDPQILVVDDFKVGRPGIDIQYPWSKPLGKENDIGMAWIWLDGLPVADPWAIPTSWGELRQCCQEQRIYLDCLLRPAVNNLRDGKEHVLLLGFPIPARVNGPDVQAHWLALRIPGLSSQPVSGFRRSESGYWNLDRWRVFGDTMPLEWVETENWHQDEISGRGRMNPSSRTKSVLIIGGGAVGSVLAEVMVRSGVQDVIIMDHDHLKAGNLVRHTLGVSHLEQPKASSLADRLDDAAVHSLVSAIDATFPPREQKDVNRVLDADVVIDCTAEDSVVEHMRRFAWDRPITFISVSVGLKARRAFTYVAHGSTFPAADFANKLDPWLRSEMYGYDEELPRDGTGCWHALMPARVDDIWMMTGAAVKTIESAIADPPCEPTLVVFEQQYENGVFIGLRRVSKPDSNL